MKRLTQNSNGGAVFWKTADSLRSKFEPLKDLGLEAFIPAPRTQGALLHASLCGIFSGPGWMVRRLAVSDGFTVLEETRGEDQNRYVTRCSAKIIDGKLEVEAGDASALHVQISQGMIAAVDQVSAVYVTHSLVKLIAHLGGVALRPSGAVYWLLNDRLEIWEQAARIYEAASLESGASVVYLMKTIADPGAIDAVCDALATDTQKHIDALHAEIAEGNLGLTALNNRTAELEELRTRAATYSTALGKGVDGLTKMIEDASQACATAIMLASAAANQRKAEKGAKS